MPIQYANERLQRVCEEDADIQRKLQQALEDGRETGGTPGPRCLANDAYHLHYAGKYGVAFRWTNDTTIEVLALGKKDGSKGQGTSGYKWSEKGKV
jgi:hypothetical protein